MEWAKRIFDFLGSIICHQLPDRTLLVGGSHLPFCARDTGIYMGLFVSFTYILFKKRLKSDKMPDIITSIVLCLFTVPLIFDGFTSYVGIRGTTNQIRLFTGALCGFSLPFFIIPALGFKIKERNTKPVLESLWELPFILAILLLTCILILKTDLVPWLLISGILIFSFLFLFFILSYVVVVRLRSKENSARSGKERFINICLSCGAAFIVLVVLYAVPRIIYRYR